jgi:hypothetical protein
VPARRGSASGDVLLVDEPCLTEAEQYGQRAWDLAAGLAMVGETGAIPVVFATPLERALLMPHLRDDATKTCCIPGIVTGAVHTVVVPRDAAAARPVRG